HGTEFWKCRIAVDVEPEIRLGLGIFSQRTGDLSSGPAQAHANLVDDVRRDCGCEIRRHDLRPAVGVRVHALWIGADASRRKRAVAIRQLIRVRNAQLIPLIEVVIEAAVDLPAAGVGAAEWSPLNGVAAAVRAANP